MRCSGGLTALIVVTLLSCSQTVAAQDEAIAIPARKPGMWELRMQTKYQPDVTMQLCVDAANDKEMMDAWLSMVTSICPAPKWSREDGAIVIASDCQSGGTTVLARAELSGDFQSEYTLKVRSQAGLGDGAKVDLVHTTRWLGEACTGGLIPGGVRLPNGARMNMKRMMKLLQNMNEQQR